MSGTHHKTLMRMQREKEIAMIAKKERTLDEYKRAGSEMRLFKQLGTRLAVDISKVISAADSDKLLRALSKVDEICSRAEDNLFRDHPDLGAEYTDVFYGSVNGEPRNDIDAEMIELAGKMANDLFS